MLCKTPAALALLAAWAVSPGLARAQTAPPPATALPAVTNTATRTERRTDEVPATVSVVPASEMEAAGARDIKELLRNQVDISVRAAAGRFGVALPGSGRAGVEGINIRGLEGNQVLMLVDGIRVPSGFSFGSLAAGRGDYLALEATAAAEVLRGPASTSFGSDGLAGALSLRTLDPTDVLKPGQTLSGFVRLSASQLDDGVGLTVAGAGRQGPWEALLLASQRQGHETRNQGRDDALNSTRTAPNPVDQRQQVVLGKLSFAATATQRLGLTLEAVRRRVDTEVYSGRTVAAVPPAALPATAVIDLDALDDVQRRRLALEHRYDNLDGSLFQKATARIYAQGASTEQFATEDRVSAADRTRTGVYREKLLGLSSQFESSLAGALPQRLSYGLDVSRTRITAVREGTPNPSAPPPFGETFPAKPFPDTDYTLAGAFVQSEIELPGLPGNLSVIPALRYDRYKLDASPSGYSGDVAQLSGGALTPRLGAVWRWSEALAPYAQWSQGYRAPAPGQVNNSFTNVAAGYRSIGNPDLKPERARSIELGLRGSWAAGAQQLQWQVAAFHNRYRDFISQETVSGSLTPADPAVFQFVNLTQASIRGLEVRADWRLSAAWSVTAATAWTRGTSTKQGVTQPLDSVEPARTALGLRCTAGAWDLRADVLHAAAKAAERIAPPATATTPAAFAPPGYTVLDLSARWQTGVNWTLMANLNNVTNATYWRWSDVRGLAGNSAVKDAYTAPGRHLQLTLRHDF